MIRSRRRKERRRRRRIEMGEQGSGWRRAKGRKRSRRERMEKKISKLHPLAWALPHTTLKG